MNDLACPDFAQRNSPIIRLRHDDTQWQPATSWMLIAAHQ
jgi:hypothetical protein